MQKLIVPTNFYIRVHDSQLIGMSGYASEVHISQRVYCIYSNLISISNICYHARIDHDDVRLVNNTLQFSVTQNVKNKIIMWTEQFLFGFYPIQQWWQLGLMRALPATQCILHTAHQKWHSSQIYWLSSQRSLWAHCLQTRMWHFWVDVMHIMGNCS